MPDNNKNFRFRPKDIPEPNRGHSSDGEDNRSLAEILITIDGYFKAMSRERTQTFFKKELGVQDVYDYEDAHIYIKDKLTDVTKAKGFERMLLEFFKHDNKTTQDHEDSNSQSNEKDSENSNEDQTPMSPEDIENMYNEGDFDQDKLEEQLREALKNNKSMLIRFLDRLDILESRVDKHDDLFKEVDESFLGTQTLLEALKNKILEALKNAPQSALPSTTSGSSGTYTFKYDEPGKEPKKMEGVFPECWERLLQLAESRMNIFMYGPSGCGKTYIAGKVAEALELRFASQSCSEGMDESIFMGMILPNEIGKFEYVPSTFVDFYENGGVYLLDEMDAADANLAIIINSAIGNDYFHIPQRRGDTLVKKHKNFICIAAANTAGGGGDDSYMRNQLDAATLDRFRAGFVKMDYDENVEKSLIDPEVYQWGKAVRKAIKNLSYTRPLSTRVMLDFSYLKNRYDKPLKEVVESYFTGWEKSDVERLHKELEKQANAYESNPFEEEMSARGETERPF